MVCMNPKIAYQRTHFPITGNISERNLKRLNKISFTYKKGWKQIELPCGECPACRLAKANDYAVRIENEAKTWQGHGCFVTLTYNNPHLHYKNGHMTLCKRDVQLFKKRLRKYIKKNNEAFHYWTNPVTGKIEKPVRTFECGEYGPKNGRPHYHMIIFNWIPNDLVFKEMDSRGYPLYKSKTLQKIWGNGFILIGTISYESASYVARYTMKKQGIAKQHRKYYDICEEDEETGQMVMKTKYKIQQGLIENEFITMSNQPGIGAKYFYENIEKIKENNGILINIKGTTKLKGIPRYYRKLWEKLDWEDYERWKYRNQQIIEKTIKKNIESYALPDNWEWWKKEKFARDEMVKNQAHKFGLLKRENILYDGNTI